LREEHGLRLFKNWLLRKISGVKNEEVIGRWRSCIRKDFNGGWVNLTVCYEGDKIRSMRQGMWNTMVQKF